MIAFIIFRYISTGAAGIPPPKAKIMQKMSSFCNKIPLEKRDRFFIMKIGAIEKSVCYRKHSRTIVVLVRSNSKLTVRIIPNADINPASRAVS